MGHIDILVYTVVTPKQQANFRIDEELMDGMHEIREKTGAPVSWQVRQAIRLWLTQQGIKRKTKPTRVTTRTRS